jgi:hypothetical protein
VKPIAIAAVCLPLFAVPASGAAAPELKCEAAKHKLASAYLACREAALQKWVLKGTALDYAKCDAQLDQGWLTAEFKAARKGAECPSEDDVEAIRAAAIELTDLLQARLQGCAGSPVGGFCWLLGVPGASCSATCEAAGLAYDEAGTRGYAGSDGTDAHCRAVATAVWGFDVPGSESSSVAGPVGCYTLEAANVAFRDMTATTAEGTSPNAYRVCACGRAAP